MRHAHAQPYEEQRAHGDELHEEVAAVWQRSSQDVGQLCWALDNLVHLLEEGAADQALHTGTTQHEIIISMKTRFVVHVVVRHFMLTQ
jgi:hypothetical protein